MHDRFRSRRGLKIVPFIIVLALGTVRFGASVHAAARYWNADSGLWSDTDNWDPSGTPIASDTLFFFETGADGISTNDMTAARVTKVVVTNYSHTIDLVPGEKQKWTVGASKSGISVERAKAEIYWE